MIEKGNIPPTNIRRLKWTAPEFAKFSVPSIKCSWQFHARLRIKISTITSKDSHEYLFVPSTNCRGNWNLFWWLCVQLNNESFVILVLISQFTLTLPKKQTFVYVQKFDIDGEEINLSFLSSKTNKYRFPLSKNHLHFTSS